MSKKIIPKAVIVLVIAACIAAGLLFAGKKTGQEAEADADTSETFEIPELSEETKARIEKAKERGNPVLIVSNAEAARDGTVIATVNLVNNPGIIGLSMTLSCDESVLELEDIKSGEAFDGVLDMNHSENLASGCSFMWDSTDISDENIRDGIVLALKFRVRKDAAAGKTPVMMVCDLEGTYDRDLSVVDLTVENGYVTVIP